MGRHLPVGQGRRAAPWNGSRPSSQLLVDRLNQRLFDRLQDEQSPDRRALIAGLPDADRHPRNPLQAFLVEAFGGSRIDPAPMLRGVYFTSGTQEGTPIDRLTGVLARTFGLDQRRGAAPRPDQGRSYFLGRLISEVIQGEAMLVSEPPGVRARRIALRAASYRRHCLGGPSGQRAGSSLSIGRCRTRDRPTCRRHWPATRGSPRTTTFDPVDDSDLPRLLPLLDAARNLQKAAGSPPAGTLSSFDLSQTAKLRTARIRSIAMPWAMRCCRG